LLVAMAGSRRGVNIRQFAARQGWNWRALYRDVATLRSAGVPVEHEHGRYRVPERWLPLASVDVGPEELAALSVARRLAPGLQDTAIGRGLASLWSKLSAPAHQPSLPLGDEAWFHASAPAAIDYSPHRLVLDAVREAIRSRRALRIRYHKPDGHESERTIEPAFVQWDAAAEALYVSAWCRERSAQRVFAIHRIARAELTDELFASRREAVADMSKAYRLWSRSATQPVVLRFSPRVAGEVRERAWHRSARLSDTSDGSVVLEMDIGDPEELERLLLGYAADVQVEAPAALAERIRARHAEAAAPAHLGMLRARRPEPPAAHASPHRAPSKP
jgi:predicted DNA-binding transcriptional regulator YafY